MAYFNVTDEEDLQQDLARSAFGDMLLDEDRNRRYKQALVSVIKQKHEAKEEANVVDIGTGSGLLSLMAAEAGADQVTALEMFHPMADIAEQIFRESRYSERIHLLKERSTDVAGGSTLKKGNIIVAEVFDSELIGEGALRTFKEAHDILVSKGSKVIPQSARVWIMPVECQELQKFNKTPSKYLESPFNGCPGTAAVFDIQLSEFEDFNVISKPFVAFSFNFEDPDSILYDEHMIHEIIAEGAGSVEAVLMWWDLDMDGSGTNYISMAPKWMDEKSQCVYYLPKPIRVDQGQKFKLLCSHDEFSFWFTNSIESQEFGRSPVCTCQMHVVCSRSALYRMNDMESDVLDALIQHCRGKSVVCLSDGSLFGLYACRSADKVAIVEPNAHFRHILAIYKNANDINNVAVVGSVEELEAELRVDTVISEPFFLSSLIPSDNYKLWLDLREIRSKYPDQHFGCFPKALTLWAMPVQFEHLWKTVAPIEQVQGFDLSAYSQVYQSAIAASDSQIDAQSLWEYPSASTGKAVDVLRVEGSDCLMYLENEENVGVDAIISPDRTGTNALVFWIEAEISGGLKMSSGLLEECAVGQQPKWSRGHRQGVHFLPHNEGDRKQIGISIQMNRMIPDLTFTYQ